jgi:hypothetical protein
VTVGELIEALRQFPSDMLCVSVGFDECGYDPIDPPRQIMVRRDPFGGSHCGFYEGCDKNGTPAIYIR